MAILSQQTNIEWDEGEIANHPNTFVQDCRPLENQTWHTNGCLEQKIPKFGFHTHITALWPMKQSCILFAKFDYPGAFQNSSFLTTVYDCETVA